MGTVARSRVRAELGPGGRTVLPVIRSEAPLRLVETVDGLVVMASLGGPLGGDATALGIEVARDAALTVSSVGSPVALPGLGTRSSIASIQATVGPGASLDWHPRPTISAAGSTHQANAAISLDPAATLWWQDMVVLGRHGEPGGSWRSRVSVSVGARPLLRTELSLGRDTDGTSLAVLGGYRAHGSLVVVVPDCDPAVLARAARIRMGLPGPMGAGEVPELWGEASALAGPGVLVSVVGSTALGVRSALDRARAGLASTIRGTP